MPKVGIKELILNEGESVVKIFRQSKFVLSFNLLIPILFILAPFFLLFLLFSYGKWGVYVFAFTLTLGLLLLIRQFVVWKFKTLIVTTDRIIDIDQKGLFKRTVSNILLSKIDDVFYKINGPIQVLAKIGNLYITMAENKGGLELKNISRPQRAQQLILQLKSDTLKEKFNTTKLSAEELVELVKRIKTGIGEKKFNQIINDAIDSEETEAEEIDEEE